MFMKISIRASKEADSSGFDDVRDEVIEDCGDYNEEEFDKFMAEIEHRARLVWNYLSDRDKA